ncbi:hypothetical protein EK21DRAFT_85842 [Setomelanomma holmii]|uniref:Uncharacterized protein n=1 Tax=Setomelanomma holmii TaxID=210430 RepID=A0A9P4HIW3_9PLEO|nr:hypothetical protein EK21DRAFT_85842 [Setomelanomma holmii]
MSLAAGAFLHGTKRKAADEQVNNTLVPGSSNATVAPKRAKSAAGSHVSNQLTEQKLVTKTRSHKKQIMPTPPTPPSSPAKLARPWLKRPQSLDEQSLFLIQYRDNLVVGATGPKPWDVVAVEFNKRFKDELSKNLAWNTLSKRTGQARKQFLRDNPEYTVALQYPVPEFEDGEEDDGDHHEEEEVIKVMDSELYKSTEESTTSSQTIIDIDNDQVTPEENPEDAKLLNVAQLATQTSTPTQEPGAYYPSLISDHNITPLDRAKYHLRHRTQKAVAIHFLDGNEADLDAADPQIIDHDILATSPLYTRLITFDPDAVLDIPSHVSHKTLNAFIQIIAPFPATTLPTHYLWRTEKQIHGILDRFDAIEPEKIHWSVGTLIELVAFAQYMEVHWVGDMVIDRLRWMFDVQTRVKEACAKTDLPVAHRDVQGRKVYLPPRLVAPGDMTAWSISVEDFDSDVLAHLVTEPVDVKTLSFIADLMRALGGQPDTTWLVNQTAVMQGIFAKARADPRTILTTSRQEFCARYHHHQSAPCYTSTPQPSSKSIVDALYTFASHANLLTYSSHLTLLTSLAKAGNAGSLHAMKAKLSTLEMLGKEKEVWEMEMRLEESKGALVVAREKDLGEKDGEMGDGNTG